MKIYGELSKLKDNQLVGIYSLQYNIWILGRVKNAGSEKITVMGELPVAIYEFDSSGDMLSPRHMRGAYSLVFVRLIPGHIRFADSNTIRNYVVDTYAQFLMESSMSIDENN